MPKLDTQLHLNMYRAGKKRRTLPGRIKQALKVLFAKNTLYGLEWGDPEINPSLVHIREHFLLPYVARQATVIEIGPGGGRWTRYMLHVNKLYAVDFHQELLDELKSNFSPENLMFVKNNGTDFPGIPDQSVDFLFSFDVFVHLDVEIIDEYLRNMRALLKPCANVVIHYSDKTKPLAISNRGFSQNDPEIMRQLVTSHGYHIYDEDTNSLPHSSVIRFGIREL